MECSIEYSPENLAAFDEQIAEMVREDIKGMQEKGGLAEYLDNRLLKRKVESMTPTVELWQDQLWGVLEIRVHGKLTESELKALSEEWSGQASDGWGEGFEQKPLQIQEGELYVSFWNSGDGFFIKTEEELKAAPRQGMSMQMALPGACAAPLCSRGAARHPSRCISVPSCATEAAIIPMQSAIQKKNSLLIWSLFS